jgi:hypothetical protein
MPRADQEQIPGMESVKNERVHRAAKRYAKARDERIALSEKEKEAHDFLLGVMTEEGMDFYEYKDLGVYVDTKRKAKVEIGPRPPENGAENGEEAEGE